MIHINLDLDIKIISIFDMKECTIEYTFESCAYDKGDDH